MCVCVCEEKEKRLFFVFASTPLSLSSLLFSANTHRTDRGENVIGVDPRFTRRARAPEHTRGASEESLLPLTVVGVFWGVVGKVDFQDQPLLHGIAVCILTHVW